MSYTLWARKGPDSESDLAIIGQFTAWYEAASAGQRLRGLLDHDNTYITDPHGEKVPEFGRLKEDYRIELEEDPSNDASDFPRRIVVQRRAVLRFEDGKPVPDVAPIWIPVYGWTENFDAEPTPETEQVIRSVLAHYRSAIID